MQIKSAEHHANSGVCKASASKAENILSLNSRRPELEDIEMVNRGLNKAEEHLGKKATVDLYYGTVRDGMSYLEDAKVEDLERVLTTRTSESTEHSIKLCLIKTPGDHTKWEKGNFSISPDVVQALLTAGLSDTLLSNMYSKTMYWAKMGNLQFSGPDLYEICYQYRCGWGDGISYIHLRRSSSDSTYFCINYPEEALKRLRRCEQDHIETVFRDFFVDALAADVSSKAWLLNIHSKRNELREWESNLQEGMKTTKSEGDLTEAIRSLHLLSQQWLSISQDAEDFQAQLAFLRDSHDVFTKTYGEQGRKWQIHSATNVDDSFKALQSQSGICMRWTGTYRSRTEVCINLLYHLANQAESRTSKKIQEDMAKVAEQTQRDSASMIVIATMTLFFLPGTFVCSILSTVFFNYTGSDLEVSHNGWLLAPAIVPLTLVVFGLWLVWLYRSRRSAFDRVASWFCLNERKGSPPGP